jgi:ribonuclease T1
MKAAKPLVVAGAIIVLGAWLLVVLTGGKGGDDATAARFTVSASASVVDSRISDSGLPPVVLTELPVQAQRTYDLIVEGGPYPYPQDDESFGNREGNLPPRPSGWYREYTVPTPGSDDRGARRFVVGQDGVFFYTDDHYSSFREVLR